MGEDIRALVLHQKHDVVHERFRRDIADLVTAIESLRESRITASVQPIKRTTVGPGVIATVCAAIVLIVIGSLVWVNLPKQTPEISVTDEELANYLTHGHAIKNLPAKPAPTPLNTTTDLAKSVIEPQDPVNDIEGREVRVVRTQRGDRVSSVLLKLGAEAWQARAMADAARTVFPDGALAPGLEMHVNLVPSMLWTVRMEPIRFSVYGDGQEHKVTVTRTAAGEFVAKGPRTRRPFRRPASKSR